jgi:hypothetical protein
MCQLCGPPHTIHSVGGGEVDVYKKKESSETASQKEIIDIGAPKMNGSEFQLNWGNKLANGNSECERRYKEKEV